MAGLVANTYATALYELGVEENKLDVFMDNLSVLKDTLKDNEKFLEILKTPSIDSNEKKQLIDNIFKEKFDNEIINFFKLLVDKRRFAYILEIIEVFSESTDKYKGIIRADVYSSFKLSEDQLNKLSDRLKEKTKKTVLLNNVVDKNLIGGLKLVMNDTTVDGSIKGKLEDLSGSLSKIIV